MKTEIKLSQTEFNEIIKTLVRDRNEQFIELQQCYRIDIVALSNWFLLLFQEYGIEFIDSNIQIKVKGK
ncbi:hypothetical protein [Photorhabdus caribbeanensis]|uniref:hypothetical protein n=1 Tax=Photorhabdus caribbeanensis TaxID=1004165 RepID=UPI001BD4C416|nr:hypothetical protein [Photorhabdus caribbeanensis]MBS9422253.1 hypothetical protein [Photorhabdus caribbeanensis]